MQFPILKNRKYGFYFSGILVFLSFFFLLAPGFGLKLGIDFIGGSQYFLSFEDKNVPSSEEITQIYSENLKEEKSPQVSREKDSSSIIIRSHILSDEEKEIVLSALQSKGFTPSVDGVSTVTSSLGDYFAMQAFWTILSAISMIVLYLAWAFRKVPKGISSWKFGLSAIIALIHDVFITVGVFAFLGAFMLLEVDTMFVTALLTVLGFSVHDTIVVFDRLRENLKGKKAHSIEKIAENSLWQTMGRSINTSVSTLFVLGAVLFWGAPSLFAFIFALTFGIFIGTYSSIFIATPFLVEWIKKDLPSENEEEFTKQKK